MNYAKVLGIAAGGFTLAGLGFANSIHNPNNASDVRNGLVAVTVGGSALALTKHHLPAATGAQMIGGAVAAFGIGGLLGASWGAIFD